MTTLKAHFDGQFIVPEEPVDLPRGKLLEIQVRELEQLSDAPSAIYARGLDTRNGLPVLRLSAEAKTITQEDVRRAEEDT